MKTCKLFAHCAMVIFGATVTGVTLWSLYMVVFPAWDAQARDFSGNRGLYESTNLCVQRVPTQTSQALAE